MGRYCHPHEGFILVESPEQVDGDVAEKVTEELFALISTQYGGRPTPLVIDQRRAAHGSAEARRHFAAVSSDPRLGRIGSAGGSVFIRTVTNFIFRMSKTEQKMRFFPKLEDAMAWVRETAEDSPERRPA